MHNAHCYLNPHNILVNIMETKIINKITWYAIVTMTGFEISKFEVGSNLETTKNKDSYDTIIYMALMVLRTKF